ATHQSSLAGLIPTLWQKRFKPLNNQAAATDDEFEAAAEAIARLAPGGLDVPTSSTEKLLSSLAPAAVTTQAELNEREVQIAALWSLATRKLLASGRVGSLVLADLEETLAAAVAAPYATSIGTYLVEEATRALRDADELGD